MKLKYFVVALVACVSLGASANNEKSIDSLKRVVESAKGNEKIHSLMDLSMLYLNESPEKAFMSAYKAYYYAAFTAEPAILSDAYFTIGMLHHKTSSFDSALVYMSKALKTSETNEQTAMILDNIGTVYKDLSRYDSAIVYHNQSLKLQQTLGNRKAVATCYKNIGNVYMQMGKYDDALSQYELAKMEYQSCNDEKSISALCNNISNAYVGMHKYSEALSYLTNAVNIQESIGDKAGEAYTLNSIGNFYFRLKVYDKAQEYYKRALDLRTKLDDKNDIAASQFNIATVHRDLGNYREALKYYNRALELRTKTDNKEAQALIYNAIGGTYKNQKIYDKAIENYQRALDLNLVVASPKAIASSYERLGMVCRDTALVAKNQTLFKQASLFYSKSIEVYRSIGDSLNAARISNFYGNLYKDFGETQSAMRWYDAANALYGKNTLGKAYVAYNQGKLMQEMHNPTAEQYFASAMETASKFEEKTLACDAAQSLYLLMKSQSKPDKALQYYERYVSLKDEIEADKNKERIAEMEFESDIKVLEHLNENQQLKIRENEMKQSQFRIYILILVLVLLGIAAFSIVLYRLFTQKKNAYALLSQKQSELESAYDDVKTANDALEKKNTQILDSMMYAKRIQKAVLPSAEELSSLFPQNFVYYMPKEIVSGDFYWLSKTKNYVFFAVVDCTGHGVPGACMSMVGNTLLNQIVNEMHEESPAKILQMIDDEVIKTLRQNEGDDTQDDGMAISLIRYDKKKSEITFAGAGQKLLIVSDGEVQTIGSSLFSIGGLHVLKQSQGVVFEETTIPVKEGSTLYLYSDGYIDQFGSETNARFSTSRFEDMVLEMQNMDMAEQYMTVSRRMDAWKGTEQQIDDILVVGIKL